MTDANSGNDARKRLQQSVVGLLGLLILPLGLAYAGLWWATALGALQVAGMVLGAALWRWHELHGWRYWYGLGAAITCALALALLAVAAVRHAWRSKARWRIPALGSVIVGAPVFVVVFFGVPILGTLVVATAWPIVLPMLLRHAYGAARGTSGSPRDDGAVTQSS